MSRYISPFLYVLLVLVGCSAFISIACVRVGMLEPLTGFSILKWSVLASLILSFLAVASLAACRKEKNIKSKRFFWMVFAVSIVYSGFWIAFYLEKSTYPNINDITTDTVVPPAFLNINFLRKSNENDLVYNHDWAQIQHQHYPDVKPLMTSASKRDAYQAVVALINERGWEMVSEYPEVGVVEATARTPVFGFRDDVVIRVIRQAGETRVDMRSCSRVGKTADFGENAARITSFMQDLANRLKDDN